MLFKLLTLPVSGPLLGTPAVLDTVLREAERQYYDQHAILQQLRQVDLQRRRGEISPEWAAQQEDILWRRMIEARRRHAGARRPNRPGDEHDEQTAEPR
jgi:hypothetical protein